MQLYLFTGPGFATKPRPRKKKKNAERGGIIELCDGINMCFCVRQYIMPFLLYLFPETRLVVIRVWCAIHRRSSWVVMAVILDPDWSVPPYKYDCFFKRHHRRSDTSSHKGLRRRRASEVTCDIIWNIMIKSTPARTTIIVHHCTLSFFPGAPQDIAGIRTLSLGASAGSARERGKCSIGATFCVRRRPCNMQRVWGNGPARRCTKGGVGWCRALQTPPRHRRDPELTLLYNSTMFIVYPINII